MGKYAKWIGGGLGWAFGGPIGAILGFFLGSAVDNMKVDGGSASDQTRNRTQPGDFGISMIVLSAAVMKADGKVVKSELEFVKKFFISQFGETKTLDMLSVMREVLKQSFSTRDVCYQISQNLDYHSRLQLMHYLFGIAQADGHVTESEYQLIRSIALDLNISNQDFDSIKAMFYKDTQSAYKILEITPDASTDEIKKAYRKMAVKYHPDKLRHLGEDFQLAAKEKFQKVNDAYETLKKERGFN